MANANKTDHELDVKRVVLGEARANIVTLSDLLARRHGDIDDTLVIDDKTVRDQIAKAIKANVDVVLAETEGMSVTGG